MSTLRSALVVILIVLILFPLFGCAPVAITKPVDAKCSSLYSTPCTPLPDWDGQYATAPGLIGSYGAMYEQCELKRQAGAECLNRLRAAKVIK